MSYFEFPHTRSYDGDLGYIIKRLDELTQKYGEFMEYNQIKFADPVEWNINTVYSAWEIVFADNGYYIAIKPVPAGIMYNNTDYWNIITPFNVDTVLSTESLNPVANKTVTNRFNQVSNSISNVVASLQNEGRQREEADEALRADINSNTYACSTNAAAISSERTARETADTSLSRDIETVNARVDTIAQTIVPGGTSGDAELADIRTAFNGVVYPNAGDAVRGECNTIIDMFTSDKTITNSIAVNTTVRFYIYAKKGQLVTIALSSYSDNDCKFAITYADGSTVTSKQIQSKLLFRAVKDITYIAVYNGSATDSYSVTISKTDAPVYLTNYYDKTAAEPGMYNNSGTIISGYRHSDFIPTYIGDKIILSAYPATFGTAQVFLFDENKTFIKRLSLTLNSDTGLYERFFDIDTVGSTFARTELNIAYAAFNMSVDGADTAKFYINNYPSDFIGYDQYEPEPEMFFNEQQINYINSNANSPISGKLIAYNGDSIAESRLAAGNSYNGGAYPKLIADLTNGTYENRAHGGGILASAPGDGGSTPARCVVSDVTNMTDDADLICFEGGINDYWRQVPLGTFSESDYTSNVDTTTICGALESIFRQAKAKWVGKPICFIITHKIKSTVYTPNTIGYTWLEVYEKIVAICKKYAIPYYDAFSDSGLNAYDDVQNTNFLTSNSEGTPDGCHPNEAGYKNYYVPQLIDLFNKITPRS